MKLPKLENMNSDRFLRDAFDVRHHDRLERDTRIRRNIYLWLFLTGIVCLFITVVSGQVLQCVLSIALSTVTLIITTKYDTQLFFLKHLQLRNESDPPDNLRDAQRVSTNK